jgi:ferredoxin-NADP reductase
VADNEKTPVGHPTVTAESTGRPAYRARIERIFDHADDVRSLFLRTIGQSLPPFAPGMFISIAIPLPDGERVRPYTIASSPEDPEPFEIVFNRIPGGAGAAWLFERRVGDEFAFTGPFGAFTLAQRVDAEMVFIVENTGIAPIRPMIRRTLTTHSAHHVHLLYAADRPEHLLYRDELDSLAAAHPRLQISVMVMEGGGGPLYARLLEETRRRWIESDADRSRHFYICGVGPGVLEIRDLLRRAGYERRAVHYEKW